MHLGHLVIAQDTMEHLGLDRVLFIPVARNPLKHDGPVAADQDRLALLHAAVDGDDRFGIETCELENGGISYTIDTVRHLRQRWPRARLFWILGADALASLERWKDINELARLVEFVCLGRPGTQKYKPVIEGLRLHRVDGHLFDISSTEIRQRLADGRPVAYFLPQPVENLILTRELYMAPSTQPN